MDKRITHTARYQLSVFLKSQFCIELPIDTTDVGILNIIADFMDSGDYQTCFAKYPRIASICHIHVTNFKKRLHKLVSLGLITRQRSRTFCCITFSDLIKNYCE
jgi:hypothetical protein